MSEQNQSQFQVLKFAVIVCLACSLVVSAAAVSLRGFQAKNNLNEKRTNILRAFGLVDSSATPSTKEIEEKFQSIIPVVVNFKTGELDTSKNPETYDMYEAAAGKEGHDLSDDPASIKRQADDGNAYVLVEGDTVKSIAIPVQGYGLWSTMYGFTALDMQDDEKLKGLTFYSQKETAGLGAEITNPRWQAKWEGIQPYNTSGQPQIQVVKNVSNPEHQVDALAGATLTSRGVENLMNYWLGEAGYRQFIENVASGKITVKDMKDAQTQGAAHQEGSAS